MTVIFIILVVLNVLAMLTLTAFFAKDAIRKYKNRKYHEKVMAEFKAKKKG